MINERFLDSLKEDQDKEIFIYGTGSFGKQVKMLLSRNDVAVNGFIDSDLGKVGGIVDGIEILSLDEVLPRDKYLIVIASTYFYEIEDLLIRKSCGNYCIVYPQQFNLHTLNHVIKSKLVTHDENVIFLNNCTLRMDTIDKIKNKVMIGQNSILGCNFIFESNEGKIRIGGNTYIAAGTNLISRDEIVIGNNVTISWGCYIYDHDSHSLNHLDRRNDFKRYREDYLKFGKPVLNKDWNTVNSSRIVIEDDVWIGFEATILKGVTIGEGAIIGTKSVVTKDVPAWSVVAGNPAKIVKYLNEGC